MPNRGIKKTWCSECLKWHSSNKLHTKEGDNANIIWLCPKHNLALAPPITAEERSKIRSIGK